LAGTGSRAVVERYIEGREIQIGILDGKALPSIEIRPREGFYDYKNKYQPGAAEEITPAPIPREAEERLAVSAMTVFNVLGLHAYSRADYIYDKEGRFWFLEINTLPGMTPTSLVPQEAAVVGIGYGELCERIIEISLEKYR
ncbi:MAG TPA: D-alanine--D-alanine ligase, partial [Clostridiales bacterium]|nr:D-alanine--D-alanine ligase [Clostridiales bacterium]